jgi:hypothetical protein
MAFCLGFIAAYGYECIDIHDGVGKIGKILPVVTIISVFLISVGMDVISTGIEFGMTNLVVIFKKSYLRKTLVKEFSWYKVIPLIFLSVPYTAVNNKKIIKVYIVVLIATQVFLFRVDSKLPGVKNKPAMPAINDVLINDHSYFRVVRLGTNREILGIPKVEQLNGFSHYFSREHRWQLENLFNKNIGVLRPHWVKPERDIRKWDEKMMGLLNIKYIITRKELPSSERKKWRLVSRDGKYHLWEKTKWRSSLWIFDRWEVLDSEEAVLREMRKEIFNPFNRVLLTQSPAIEASDSSVDFKFEVKVLSLNESEIVIKLFTNKNGILFIPEYYDNGWKAEVDGIPAEVLRVNASFRGVEVREGEHKIVMHYSPRIVYVGAIISGITTLFCVTLSYFVAKRRAVNSRMFNVSSVGA